MTSTNSLANLQTRAAVSLPWSLGAAVSVFFCIFVSLWAMRDRLVVSGCGNAASIPNADTALQINTSRDWFQMRGIDAAMDPAQMIEVESFWNWTNKQRVGNAMSQPRNEGTVSALYCESCVTSLICFPQPKPATAVRLGRYIRQQSFKDVADWLSHRSSVPANRVCRMMPEYWEAHA